MARLVYSALASLDGFIADEAGNFDWAVPDEKVHAFINDLERSAATYLYGRRMYETMMAWETEPEVAAMSPAMGDFAQIWQAAEKVVYSRTLETVSTAKTRIERSFDSDTVRKLKAERDANILIGGPELAVQAFAAELVDECQLFIAPVLVGGGKRAFPDGVRLQLELTEERRFSNGMVFLGYSARA